MKPRSYLAGHEGAALVSTFARLASQHGAAAIQRMVDALDVTLGTKAHQYPDQSYFPEAACIPGLHPQPWHDPTAPALREITTLLEGSFPAIREEAAALLNRPEVFSPYAVEPRQAVRLSGMKGDWQVCFLKHPARSTEVQRNRSLCPVTAALLDQLSSHLISFGTAELSVLQPGTVLPPHTGDANHRLTVHLPLIVPGQCRIEVAGEARELAEGRLLVFDDSFLHSSWNHGAKPRVTLMFEIWNPELSPVEREAFEALVRAIRPVGGRQHARRIYELVVEQRVDSEGRHPATQEDLARLPDQLLALEKDVQELLKGGMAVQHELLETYRDLGLGRSLDWVPPASIELPELTPTTRLRSRARGTYLILKCSSAGQPPQMQIEYRDRILEIEPEWIPFFELVLSGQEFQVSDAVRIAPPGKSDLAPEYLQTLREEHLVQDA